VLLRRRPVLADVALVAVLLVPALAARVGDLHALGSARAFSVALVLPLLVRRRWPVAVFALIASIAAVQWLADVKAVGDVALLVALYGVAAAEPRRTTLVAFAVVEVGIVLAAVRWDDGDGTVVSPIIGLTGLAVAATVMGTSTRNRHALVASLHERAARLERERDQQDRLSTAAERARIAREMHDIVAHNLSVMIALADGAAYALHDDPDRAEQAMGTASRIGRQAIGEMRRLLGVLREEDATAGVLTPQPGLAQLDELVAQVRAAGLPVELEVHGPGGPPPAPGLELALYRIAQEALTNTLKHAGARARARLTLCHDADGIELEVTDTGPAQPQAGSDLAGTGAGVGLAGMRQRAAIYDGVVEAGPRPGGGWGVRLVVPLGRPLVAS